MSQIEHSGASTPSWQSIAEKQSALRHFVQALLWIVGLIGVLLLMQVSARHDIGRMQSLSQTITLVTFLWAVIAVWTLAMQHTYQQSAGSLH